MRFKSLIFILFFSFSALGIEQSFHLTIPMQQMSVTKTYIYSQPSLSAETLKEISFQEVISVQDLVIDEGEPWWELQLKTGDIGYIRTQDFAYIYNESLISTDENFSPYLLGLTNAVELLLLNQEINVDYKLAMPYLEEALTNNHPTAYWLRGITYRDGLGREEDIDAAIVDFLRASNGGETRAFYDLALMFADKNGKLFNVAESLRLCRSGAEKGDPRAKEWLASLDMATVSEKSDPSQILLKKMLKRANEHDTQAMRLVAALYQTGRGTAMDGIEAEKWLTKAALLGDNQAMLDLAALYLSGNQDIPPDSEQATYWYRLAAENGHPKAQYLYGNALYYGLGIQKDEVKAIKWLKKAARGGYRQAMFDLRDLDRNDP